MSDPKHPVPGDLVIDASDLTVVDLSPDGIPKLLKFHDGSDKAMANVERLKAADIERAGLNEKDVQRLFSLIGEHRRAGELLPAAEKLAELLYETRLDRAHQISVLFGEICSQARRRAARSPNGAEILGPLQDLLDYQSAPAYKAAATREKAKAAQGDAAPAPGQGPL